MKNLLLTLLVLVSSLAHAEVKITNLPLGHGSTSSGLDVFPFVDVGGDITKKMTLGDLVSLPSMSAKFATFASTGSPTFSGTVTAAEFVGDLTGDITGTAFNVTGIVQLLHGGTGVAAGSASQALNALLPSQTGHAGLCLHTDGSSTAWDVCGGASAPASNAGHNILTGTTIQTQLDETDAFLSSLGLQYLNGSSTANPAVFTLDNPTLNVSAPLVFNNGVAQRPSADFSYAVILGVPTVTFIVAPDSTSKLSFLGLTANSAGGQGSCSGGYTVHGSVGSPILVGLSGLASYTDCRALVFLASTGGAVNVTANPQISAGVKIGQEMRLVGTSDVNYPIFEDGNGLSINGPFSQQKDFVVDLYWNGSVWVDADRNK